MTAPLLDVRGLRKYFPIAKGMLRRVTGHVRAVDDVSFTVQEGETLGLVGESGCGKTTTARCILRAIEPTEGQILFRSGDKVVDLAPMSSAQLGPLRKQIQMIFQDPFGSLNPRMTLFDNVGEPLLVNGMRSRRERMDRVAELLRLVGLRSEFMHRFPARVQRRSASAHRHRPRAGDQPAACRRRRTCVGIGRIGTGSGAEPVAGAAIAAAADLPVRRA